MSILVELGHATVLFSERAEGDLGRTVGEPNAEVLANRAHQILGLIPSSARNHFLGSPFFVTGPFQNIFS